MLIAYVAVRKRNQRLDEILIFLPALYWNQESCFFCRQRTYFLQAYTVWSVRIYSKRTSACCAKWNGLRYVSRAYIAWQSFFENNLDEVRVKINLISYSRYGVSLQEHL